MYVLVVTENERVKLIELYYSYQRMTAAVRFEKLKQIHGGANVCLASRKAGIEYEH